MALAHFALTGSNNSNDSATYATGNHTVTARRLVLVWVTNSHASAAAEPSSIDGHGVVWSKVGSQVSDTGLSRVTVYQGIPAANSTDTVDITFGAAQTSCTINVHEWSGTGTPVVLQQRGTSVLGNGPLTTMFNPTGTGTGRAMVCGMIKEAAGAYTAGTGYTIVNDTEATSPTYRTLLEYNIDPTTTQQIHATYGTSTTVTAIGVELFEPPAGSPNLRLLTEGESTSDSNSYSTASVTPRPNALVLACISVGHSTAVPAINTVTGNGLTWVSVAQVTNESQRRTAVYRAMGASPTAGAIQFSLSGTAGNCAWRILEFDAVDTSGTNGSGAIGETKTGTGTGSSKGVVFDNFPVDGSGALGVFNADTTSDEPVPGAQFVEIGVDDDTNPSTPSTRLFTEWDPDHANNITVDATGGSGATWETVAVEVKGIPAQTVTMTAGIATGERFGGENLLTPQQQSFEDNTKSFGWYEQVNCTLSTSTEWSPQLGSRILRITPVAVGNVSIDSSLSGNGVPVTPGVDYTAALWLVSWVARSYEISIMWWTSAGAPASTPATTVSGTSSSSFWAQRTFTGTAPANAARASLRYRVLSASPSGGEAHFLDDVRFVRGSSMPSAVAPQVQVNLQAAPSSIASAQSVPSPSVLVDQFVSIPEIDTIHSRESFGNLLTYNQASLEEGVTTGWTGNAGTIAIADISYHGSKSLQLTTLSSTTAEAVSTTSPVVPGQWYSARAMFRSAALARTANVQIRWGDAGNGLIGTSSSTDMQTTTTSGWVEVIAVGQAPANAAWVSVKCRIENPAGGGEVHYIDRVTLNQVGRGWMERWWSKSSPNVIDETLTPTLVQTAGAVDYTTLSIGGSTNNFDAVIEGVFVPDVSGNYTFYVLTDDGARLYVDGTMRIDGQWATGGAAAEFSWTQAMTAGQRYLLRVEYYQGSGGQRLRLQYESAAAGIAKQNFSDVIYPATFELPPPTTKRYVTGITSIPTQELVRRNLLDPQVASMEDGTTTGFSAFNSSLVLSNEWGAPTSANRLTTNQQGFETDTSGWGAGNNTNIARQTSFAIEGSAGLSMTSIAAGDMAATTFNARTSIKPGEQVVASASFRSAAVSRQVGVELFFFDAMSGGNQLSQVVGTTQASSTTKWTTVVGSAQAPDGAVSVGLVLRVKSTGGASEVHYADRIGLWDADASNGRRNLAAIVKGATGIDRGLQTSSVPLEIGKVYTFAFNYNAPQTLANTPQLGFFNGPAAGDNRLTTLPASTSGWVRYAYTFVAATTTTQLRITYGSQTLTNDEPPFYTGAWSLTEAPSHGNLSKQDTLFTLPAPLGWAGNAGPPVMAIGEAGSLRLGGASGAYVSTPDHADFDLNGDFTLEFFGSVDNWQTGTNPGLIGKWTSTATPATSSYLLAVNNGIPALYVSNGSSAPSIGSSVNVNTIPDYNVSMQLGLKVTWRQSDGQTRFWWTTDPNGETWTQLGTDRTVGAGFTLNNSATQVQVGGYNGASGLTAMDVRWAQIRTGIDGTVRGRFDGPAAAATEPKVPTSVAQGGKTWTINGTGWAWIFSYAGSNALVLQAKGASPTNGLTFSPPHGSAVPGREYTVGGWVRSSVARACNISLDFHGTSGYIGGSTQTFGATSSTTAWTYLWSRAVAPAGATRVVPIVNVNGAAADEMHFFDTIDVATFDFGERVVHQVEPASLPTGERFGRNENPNPSVETNDTGWVKNDASGSVSTLTRTNAQAKVGSWSMLGDCTTTGSGYPRWHSPSTTRVLQLGETITFSVWVKGTPGDTMDFYVFNDAMGSSRQGVVHNFTTTDWVKVSTTYTVEGQASTYKAYVRPAQPGQIYIDQMEYGSEPSVEITNTVPSIPSLESWGNLLNFDRSTNETAALHWNSGQGSPDVQVASERNLLSLNQASIEIDTSGLAGFRATISRVQDAGSAVHGTWVGRATTNQTTLTNWGTSGSGTGNAVAVVPGDTLTASGWVTQGQGSGGVQAAIDLRDAVGAYLGTMTGGSVVTVSATPQQTLVSGVVPETIGGGVPAFAELTLRANWVPATGDHFDFDAQAVYKGTPPAAFELPGPPAFHGLQTVSMTSTVAGPQNMDLGMGGGAVSTFVPVIQGQTYTVTGAFRAASTTRSCLIGLHCYSAAGAFITSLFGGGSSGVDSNSSWTQYHAIVTIPIGTGIAYVSPNPIIVGVVGAGETHYVDAFGVFVGSRPANGWELPSPRVERHVTLPATSSITAPNRVGGNVLDDPGYELTSPTSQVGSYFTSTITTQTSEKLTGSRALQVVTAGGSGNASGVVHMAPQGTTVMLGETITISAWVKGPAGVAMNVGARWLNVNDGGYVGEITSLFHTFSGNWERISLVATNIHASTGAARPGFQIYRSANAASITYWIDSVVLEVADNLVANGGFETDASGWVGANGSTMTRDTSQFWSGIGSGRVNTPASGDGHVVDTLAPGVPGAMYVISFAAKADQTCSSAQNATTTTTLLGVQEESGGFRWIAKPAAPISLTTSWQQFTFSGIAPDDVAGLRVVLRGGTTGSAGVNVYYDNVQVAVVGEGMWVNHEIPLASVATGYAVPSPVVLGGMYPQTIGPNVSIPLLKHTFGGNMITQSTADGTIQAGNATVAVSTMRPRSGTGMLQTQIIRGRNLLTANQASLETDTTGWEVYNTSASSMTSVNTVASDGSRALQLTSNGTQAWVSAQTLDGLAGYPVTGSTVYSAQADFRSAAQSRNCYIRINWYDSGGVAISGNSGTGTASSTTGWITRTATFTSPSNAAFANVRVVFDGAPNGEVHYVDKVSMVHGSTPAWNGGGAYQLVEPYSPNTGSSETGPLRIPVQDGASYTLSGYGRQLYGTGRSFRVKAWYYDADGDFVGALNSTTVTLTTNTWTLSGPTSGTVPAGAAYAVLVASYFSTTNMLPGETFFCDDISFTPNTTTNAPKRLGFNGAANGYWQTPDRPELRFNNDPIDIRVGFETTASGSTRSLLGKWQTNMREYRFDLGGGGQPQFYGNPNGLFATEWSQAGTAIPSFSDGTLKHVRLTLIPDNGNNQHVVTFYTSTDGVAWSQLSQHIRTGVTNLHSGTAPLYIGSIGGGAGTQNFDGGIVYAEVRRGIDGEVVERFDARTVTALSGWDPVFVPSAVGGQRLTPDQASCKVPSAWSGNSATLKRSSGASVIDGTFGLRVTSTTTSGGWGPFINSNVAPSVIPGKTYTVWFWATKGIGNHSVRPQIEWRDATHTPISWTSGTPVALTTTPQLLSVSGQAPANAAVGMVNAYTSTGGAVGDTFDIDAAGFVEGGLWTPPAAGLSSWFWDMGAPSLMTTFEHRLQSIIFAGPPSTAQMISTPDSANHTVGDLELECEFTVPPGGLPNTAALMSKWNDGSNAQKGFTWWQEANGTQTFIWWDGAAQRVAGSSGAPALTPGDMVAVKVTFQRDTGSGQHRLRFWRRVGGYGRWTLISSNQASGGGVSQIQDSTEPLTIGAYNGGTSARFVGKMHRAVMRNGISGPIVALWDSEFTTPTGITSPSSGIQIPHGSISTTWAITGSEWAWEYDSSSWGSGNTQNDTRHSTLAPPQGTQGFNVHLSTLDGGAREGSVSAGIGAGTIDPTLEYTGLLSQRWLRPLPGRLNQLIKINWASGVGYQGESNNSPGFAISERVWTDGHRTGTPSNSTVDRASLHPWMSGVESGDVWLSTAYALQPGGATEAAHEWEEVAPEVNHRLTATAIPSAQSVPSDGRVRLTVNVPSIRAGQNAIRLRGGAYMSAPGDNLVSAVTSSYEASSATQGIVGIPQANQATLTTTTEAWPNLFSSNEAGVETDSSGWASSGGSPTVTSSTDFALDGTRSLKVVSTATVSSQAITVATFPVVLGRTYTAKAWVRGGTTGRTCRVAINFRNAGGSIVVDANGNNVTSSTTWQESVATGVPSDPAITQATVKVLLDSSVIGDTVYFDRMSLMDVTDPAPGIVDGVQAARVQSSGGPTWGPYEHIRGATGTVAVVTAGQQYTLTGWLTKGQGQYSIQPRIEWRDTSNNTISVSSGTAVTLSGVAQLASVTATAPTGATNCTVTFYSTTTGVAGDYFFVDKVCFRQGASTTFLDSYHPGLDLDVRVGFIPDILVKTAPGSLPQTLIGKYDYTSDKRSWVVQINPDSSLLLKASGTGGAGPATMGSTATLASAGYAPGSEMSVKVTLQVVSSTNRVAQFWHSNNDGGTWTQLGATVTQAGALTNGLYRSNAPLIIGVSDSVDLADPFEGEIVWAELLTSINGGRVFRFDAADTDPSAVRTPGVLVAV